MSLLELVPVLIPVLVMVGISTIIIGVIFREDADKGPATDPRAILAQRLANGEITPDEFDVAMRALGYETTSPS